MALGPEHYLNRWLTDLVDKGEKPQPLPGGQTYMSWLDEDQSSFEPPRGPTNWYITANTIRFIVDGDNDEWWERYFARPDHSNYHYASRMKWAWELAAFSCLYEEMHKRRHPLRKQCRRYLEQAWAMCALCASPWNPWRRAQEPRTSLRVGPTVHNCGPRSPESVWGEFSQLDDLFALAVRWPHQMTKRQDEPFWVWRCCRSLERFGLKPWQRYALRAIVKAESSAPRVQLVSTRPPSMRRRQRISSLSTVLGMLEGTRLIPGACYEIVKTTDGVITTVQGINNPHGRPMVARQGWSTGPGIDQRFVTSQAPVIRGPDGRMLAKGWPPVGVVFEPDGAVFATSKGHQEWSDSVRWPIDRIVYHIRIDESGVTRIV